jgi:hypothetical protein|tara:strand:+ start:13971 stop:14246 length:276 start_codon:yes stop_codon:yes gene_type:complete
MRGVCRYLVPIIVTYAIFSYSNANANGSCEVYENERRVWKNRKSTLELKLKEPGVDKNLLRVSIHVAEIRIKELKENYEKCKGYGVVRRAA